MAIPSSLSLDYDALLTTTLFNVRRKLEDTISTSNALLYMLKNKEEKGWNEISSVGERKEIPLMYALQTPDSYSGYDLITPVPIDGITAAFWDWRQAANTVSISRKEERQNSGEARILNLLESKVKQAELGFDDFFGRTFWQGNGPNSATAITTPWTSPVNASLFIDPIPKLIAFDPTASVVIGNINQATYTWWRNQTLDFTGITTYAAFLTKLRRLNNLCSKGPGGPPNLHACDQFVYETYEAALASMHQNPSYNKADIPFDNIAFKGKPLVWDEFVPDAKNGTIASIPVATSGSWYMFNTKFWSIEVDKETNFMNTPFERPVNQDAKSSMILWLGASCVSNRRKQGVGGGIPTSTIA